MYICFAAIYGYVAIYDLYVLIHKHKIARVQPGAEEGSQFRGAK